MPYKNFLRLTVFLFIASTKLFAQATKDNSPYVFPEFVKATVLQKGGAMLEAQMNYNMATQEMLFTKDGANMVLDNYENIDTLYLNSRKFVPARRVFLEKLTNTAIPLYIQYKGKAMLGGSSAIDKSNNTSIGGLVGVKGQKGDPSKITSYDLRLPNGYHFVPENEYWLQKGGSFYPTNNLKKIVTLFPGKEGQINDFIKQNNISMGKTDDMIKLIEFCNK
ncbi:hypothetical protein [Mucilaginibacter sp.]|jgi:hypothetical protein|uniref:hypothetical protein n=1 Tax=Mucilaginibacter sp. TaxID=1882438 RepID=UPI003569502F